MTGTIKRVGGSLAIIIPKPLADQQGFSAGESIELTEQADGLLLRRCRKALRRPMSEIAKAIDPKAYAEQNKALLADRPVGREVW
jgi:antitoxin component of MazEF toxin-antitoxin module